MQSGPREQKIARFIGWGIIAATVLSIIVAAREVDQRPRTTAAEIEAPVMHISASVPGRVVEIKVANNAAVNRGDVVFAIDPAPYKLRVEQARAEVSAAESELAQGTRNLSGQHANAAVAQEQIKRAEENLALAESTLARLEPLLPRGFVTAQQVDQARTSRNDARISLDQALVQARGTSDVIGTLDTRQAQLDVARASLALAEYNLANTVVRTPFDGKITGFKLAVGEYLVTGQAVATLIDTANWEAVANFREVDLGNIKAGSKATVFVMTDQSIPLRGVVESVGWGVRSDETVVLRGLPIVEKSLNWVRVARRYPVTVKLLDVPERLLRIGASAIVVVGNEPAEHAHSPHR